MFLQRLLFLVGFLLIANADVNATTIAEECQRRAMIAYDRGASDAERQSLGADAASACFKEMKESLKTSSTSSSSSGGSGINVFVWIFGIAFAFVLGKTLFLSRADTINKCFDEMEKICIIEEGDTEVVKNWKRGAQVGLADGRKFAFSSENTLPARDFRKMLGDAKAELNKLIVK